MAKHSISIFRLAGLGLILVALGLPGLALAGRDHDDDRRGGHHRGEHVEKRHHRGQNLGHGYRHEHQDHRAHRRNHHRHYRHHHYRHGYRYYHHHRRHHHKHHRHHGGHHGRYYDDGRYRHTDSVRGRVRIEYDF